MTWRWQLLVGDDHAAGLGVERAGGDVRGALLAGEEEAPDESERERLILIETLMR